MTAVRTKDANGGRDRRRASRRKSTIRGARDWSLLSPQGNFLFYIAAYPGSTVREIAAGFGRTERAAWAILRDLRRAGMVRVVRDARKFRHFVHMDAPLRHPVLRGYRVRSVLSDLIEQMPAKGRREGRAG